MQSNALNYMNHQKKTSEIIQFDRKYTIWQKPKKDRRAHYKQ